MYGLSLFLQALGTLLALFGHLDNDHGVRSLSVTLLCIALLTQVIFMLGVR